MKSNTRILRVLYAYLKQSSQMNFLTNYENTLLAMSEIEGEGWLDKQLNASENTPNTAPHVLKYLLQRDQELKEDQEALKSETDPEEIDFLKRNINIWSQETVADAIYGRGGYNRWFVRGNGEVVFSKMHAFSEDLKKAKQLGFEIFD